MFPVALSSTLLTALSAASLALAQGTTTSAAAPAPAQSTYPAVPLAQKRFASPEDLPYKVDTDVGLIRGDQYGYNICNSTTETQTSRCQTSYFNSIDDFCLWGPPEYGREVGDIEGIMVAWCTKPGHGTRLIPANALQGVQWMVTPDYVQAVGYIDQTFINILRGDWGGEMDPHGADLRGNPMGGVIFSNAYNNRYEQVVEWHNFVGGNKFCFKACDPNGPNAAHFCEHIYDRIGCDYNAPSNARNGTFESCEGENQDFPGTYTQDGQVMTYTQPAESLGPITTIPYTARMPASSNCVTYTSSLLYSALPTAASPDGPSTTAGSTTATGSITRSTASTGASSTGTATAGGSQAGADGNGASALAISGVSILGVVFSALFFA